MKEPKTFSIDPDHWKRFIGETSKQGRQASPVLRALIDAYLQGNYNPYTNDLVDWQEQARIAFLLEELKDE